MLAYLAQQQANTSNLYNKQAHTRPVNTRYWANVVLKLAHRLQCWANRKPTPTAQQMRGIDPMLVQWRASVADHGTALNQHRVYASCVLAVCGDSKQSWQTYTPHWTNAGLMLAHVYDAGAPLNQLWINAWCLLANEPDLMYTAGP